MNNDEAASKRVEAASVMARHSFSGFQYCLIGFIYPGDDRYVQILLIQYSCLSLRDDSSNGPKRSASVSIVADRVSRAFSRESFCLAGSMEASFCNYARKLALAYL